MVSLLLDFAAEIIGLVVAACDSRDNKDYGSSVVAAAVEAW